MINKIPFSFKQFVLENNCNEKELEQWLKEKKFHFSLRKTVLLNRIEHKRLLNYAKLGIENSFQQLNMMTIKSVGKRIIAKQTEIVKIEQELQTLNKKISSIEKANPLNKTKDLRNILSLKTLLDSQISLINEEIDQKKKEHSLSKGKLKYLIEQEKRITIDAKIKEMKSALEIKTKEIEKHLTNEAENRRVNKIIKVSNLEVKDNLPTFTLMVEWNNLKFHNGFISIKVGAKWLERFQVNESKESLNLVKSIYKFKNAPKLKIDVIGNSIQKVHNMEVLEYYVTFLSFTDSFDKCLLKNNENSISKYRKYTKSFYDKHFPNIFLPKCFAFLCKFTVEDLPIILIPETVINSSGKSQIHDSFLFPINKNNKISWVWESIQEFKASYVFKTNKSYESNLQAIFDYLTGEVVNKRQNLITNSQAAKYLGLEKRVFHTDEANWKAEIKKIK